MTPTENNERTHHKHGMSVLNYLAACSGFASRGGTNEAAEDGTRLHGVMDQVVRHVCGKQDYKERCALQALKVILATNTVTEEEEIYLEFCCRELDKWLARTPEGARVEIEQRVYIHHPNGQELNFGHYDTLIFLSEEIAILVDYKFGWIPVPDAASNWQGKGYAIGCFQKYPRLKKIGVVFIQPKLHRVTNTHYKVEDCYAMFREVRDVIAAAENPNKTLRPGPYCDYCAHAGTCTALLNEAEQALTVYEGLPAVPAGFTGLQINTAEDAVRAMYVLDRLKVLLEHSDDLKAKAKDFARANNGFLAAPLPDGRLITVELKSRSSPRSADSPGLIAEALKDFISSEQVLGACDLNITTLEKIFAEALVSQHAAEAQGVIAQGEAEARKLESSGDLTGAAQARENAKREAKETRLTKKRATEMLSDILTAEGLLSRPDGRVEYLKMRVEKQVTNNTSKNICQ